jgi:putative Holliday junction resolvase
MPEVPGSSGQTSQASALPPSSSAKPETLLAFDFGVRHIGVALGNTLSASARPLTLIDSVPTDQRFARIAELIRTWQPDRLVVGRPLDEDGSLTETTRLAERFANQLRGRFGLAVEAVDERFSSREAQAIIAATGRRGARSGQNGGHDDPMAAAVILAQYLDGLGRSSSSPPPVSTS